jgi:integrase
MDYLRLAEIPRYLDACDDVYRPLAETVIATGLRISEALELTWDDVDFSAQTLRVLRSRKADGADRRRAIASGRLTSAPASRPSSAPSSARIRR